MKRDSQASTAPPWTEGTQLPRLQPLTKDLHADVCVVGAGISGLSVAYELARASRSVVVIDDGPLGDGETGRTTAHLVNAFDDRYHAIERLHGEEGARLTAESHTAAIAEIARIAAEEGIECRFEYLDGFLFAPPGEPPDELEREFEACRRAGLSDVVWVERAPLEGFETGRCLCFRNQAKFHPLRYLAGLVRAIEKLGGQVYGDTHASKIEGGSGQQSARVETGEGGPVITAADVVVATNTPVNDRLTIHTKQYAYRTYVIGARAPRGSIATALFWDTPDPYHYARLVHGADDDLLLVGGEDHKTGQEGDGEDRHLLLERWARQRFPSMSEVEYRWSGQVVEPMDGLAFIGLNPGDENVWIVSGDSGNGMTHGAIAGMMLRDLILDRESPWQKLYEPSRKSLRAALEFAGENLNMAAQYRDWLTTGDVRDESEIRAGAGAIVRHGLRKVAVYRDEHGTLHRMSAVCPHLGAIVRWNPEEKSWDCPAHGSRFLAEGKVMNGPANQDLAPAEDEAKPDEKSGTRRASA